MEGACSPGERKVAGVGGLVHALPLAGQRVDMLLFANIWT